MLTTGSKLGPYEILAPLGAGGMGEVYRARDDRLHREVAIKVLPSAYSFDETARQRFLREARAASALNHPNIITIYESDFFNGIVYIAMEYVRGRTLADLMHERPLTDDESITYATQIAEALAKAHAAGIIHRDLKPGNIMVTEDGLVKVLDFGLAKLETAAAAGAHDTPAPTASLLSIPGTTMGTLSYMSPEQARGEPVDARSDIFVFGIVLFEMLTRQLPFEGENILALMHALHFGAPKDLAYLRPDLPKDLVAIVGRCLQKQPSGRYQNATEISRDLRAVAAAHKLSNSSRTTPTFTAEPSVKVTGHREAASASGKKLRSRKMAIGLVALCMIAAAVVLASRNRILELVRPATARSPSESKAGTEAPPDNPFALQQQAQTYLERWDVPDNLDRSLALLNRALELDANYAPAYASLTFAYFEKNRRNPDPQWVKQATQSAARALQLNDDLAEAHLAGGVAAMLNGHNDEAEREFNKAAELDPKSSKPHLWTGFMFSASGKTQAAEKELNRALALDPSSWRARMDLGLLYYKTARYPEAAGAWEQVSKLTPDNFIVLNNLAAVYHMLDRYDDAAAALQRSLQIKPNAYTYGNLGTLRFFQGRYEDAVPAFEKAVQLEANEYLWWGNLGDGYRWAPGQRAKAKPAYENAIRLARERLAAYPDDQDARTYLALYLAKTGDRNSALAEVAKFDHTAQREAENLFRSAIVHELCGERDAAIATLSAAVKQGYSLREIRNEPELLSLRADPRYQTLLTSAARK